MTDTDEYEDDQFKNDLEALIDIGGDDATIGVAKQILGKGMESLTPKQQWVFDNKIKPALTEKCAAPGCTRTTRIDHTYCPTCEIEYSN